MSLHHRLIGTRNVRRRLLAVALTVAGFLGMAQPGQAAKKVKCDPAAGWTSMSGRAPSYVAGGATGLYVWQEAGKWRVGATNDRAARTTFVAVLTFDAPISAKPQGTEGKSDIIDIRSQSVRFRFSNFGGLDGVSIEAPCASTISVQGLVDGQPLTPQQLFFGPLASNPASVPAVISKGVAPPSTTASSVVAQPGAVVATACPTSPWPASVSGQPKLRRGPAGLYAWIDTKGVLRLAFEADAGSPRLFEGRVVANAPVALGSNSLERKDLLKVAGQQVTFSLKVGGAGDAFEVSAPCASSFSIELTVDGVPIAPATVFVGAAATPAAAVPLVLSRP